MKIHTEKLFCENDFVIELCNGEWNGEIARIVSVDKQNNIILLDRYIFNRYTGLALCSKFFH